MKLPSEYNLAGTVTRGASGKTVRQIQEWLTLNGVQLKIDGSYGPATQAAVRLFQKKMKLPETGSVEQSTYNHLIAPIVRVLQPLAKPSPTYSRRVIAIAKLHLREHPREVGGANAGPWVRLYTGGKEGAAWPWCAGFVTTMLQQALGADQTAPIKGSLSCDVLASQAQKVGRFYAGAQVQANTDLRRKLGSGCIFLVRNAKNSKDWTHTGLVTRLYDEYFETIEGNTNDSGDREGYEVCARRRGFKNMDFIDIR